MESEQSASADDRGGPDSGVLLAEANKVRANEQFHDSNGHQHSRGRPDAGPGLPSTSGGIVFSYY